MWKKGWIVSPRGMKGFVFLLTLAGLGWEKESSNGGDEGNEKNYDNVILNASIICLMSSIYAFSPPGGLLEWRTGKSQQNSVEKQREEEKFVFVFTSNRTHAVKHIVSDISLAPWYWKKLARWKKKIFFCLYLCIIWFFAFFASQTWNLIKYVLLASACAYVCGNRDSNKNHVIHSQQLSVYNVLPSLPPWPFRALSFSCKS